MNGVMTVKEVIKELRKQNPEAVVIWVDHDQNPADGEYNGYVARIEEGTPMLTLRLGPVVILSP